MPTPTESSPALQAKRPRAASRVVTGPLKATPRALFLSMCKVLNRGPTPEEWRAEVAERRAREAARQAPKE